MKKISIILIIIGVAIAASPLIGQWYTKYQENKMIDQWLDNSEADTVEPQETMEPEDGFTQLQDVFSNEDTSSVEATSQSTSETVTAGIAGSVKKPAVSQTVLGVIKINKIKVKAPIVEGVKAGNLRVGVGHIPGTSAIGKLGNCALAGHRSYTFGKFFNRLDEVVVGDEIVLTTKKEDLYYKVYEKLVVKPNDVSVLKGSKDKSTITLITCTPIYVASHRLILHASLEKRVLREP